MGQYYSLVGDPASTIKSCVALMGNPSAGHERPMQALQAHGCRMGFLVLAHGLSMGRLRVESVAPWVTHESTYDLIVLAHGSPIGHP